MITLFGCTNFFNFVSFLLYPMEVKRLRCAMLGAFTARITYKYVRTCMVETLSGTFNAILGGKVYNVMLHVNAALPLSEG